MSGPFGAGGLQLFGAGVFYPYNIDQSLRFEDGDSPYLQRTSANGDTRTWTVSFWTKLCSHDTYQYFLCSSSTSDEIVFRFNNDGTINFQIRGGLDASLTSTRTFRDLSAWLHMVVRVDTTQSTSTDRVRIYANNELISLSGTYPDQNDVTTWNKNSTNQIIGRRSNGTFYVNSYMAEIHNIDGQSLGPDSFGETKAGIWIPKEYTGSYGTAGFHLDFADSSAIGNDVSGNNNDLTVSGLDANDVMLDSPTNNWCTVHPVGSLGTQSEGNLKTVTVGTGSGIAVGSMGHTSGKWYWEVNINTSSTADLIGVVDETLDSVNSSSYPGYLAGGGGEDSIAYYSNGNKYINGTGSSYGATFTTGDIIGVALNLDDNEITFYKNNSSQGTISYTFSGGNILPASSDGTNTSSALGTFTFNFGQDSSFAGTETAQGNTDANGKGDFYYSPPSGFLALCSANLPNPGIDPAKDKEPADYFNTVLWSGDGSQTRSLTGVGFQPDFTWMKLRSSTIQDHQLYDVVRGAGGGKTLASNTTAAEGTANTVSDSDYGYLSSFDSDGFSVNDGAISTVGGYVNYSGRTYVAWNWLAGGTASSNTDGSITSSVSANTEAGFSVFTYTGNGTNGATVGHGLSSKPEFFVIKNRDASTNWIVYTSVGGATKNLVLEYTDAFVTSSTRFNDTEPTDSVISLGTSTAVNGSSTDYVVYCFHSVDGYSKVGSYSGNGSTDGTFIYTGFRPAWILFKCSSNGTASWILHDTARNTYNASNKHLRPNTNAVENTGANETIDILSNGFKHRGVSNYNANASGQTYIYLAFAEQPFKYANAR